MTIDIEDIKRLHLSDTETLVVKLDKDKRSNQQYHQMLQEFRQFNIPAIFIDKDVELTVIEQEKE